MLQRAKDDPGVEKFLEYFYKHCVETLFRPFGDIPEFKNASGMTAADCLLRSPLTSDVRLLVDHVTGASESLPLPV